MSGPGARVSPAGAFNPAVLRHRAQRPDMDRLADPIAFSLTLMAATMIEMDDGAQLRTWTAGPVIPQRLPVVMVHGGPGGPDYLAPVAGIVGDLCLVHRYDQRGTGGSPWEGEHTIARHVQDLASLLDAWGHDRVVLTGHSFGTNMASYFLLAHPGRVAGLIQLAGPFLDPWREADLAAQRARRSDDQQARLGELDAIASRTDAEEIEYLTLSWFTDHADRGPRLGLGAGRSPHPAPRQLRDEHPAQRREENRPARITRGRTSRAPAARRGHHRRSRRYPPRRCPATSRSMPPLRGHHHSGRGARAMAGSTRPVHCGAPRQSGETDPCKTRCVRSGRNGRGQIKASAVIQLEPDQAPSGWVQMKPP